MPFERLGFDADYGSEFLNGHLVRYFQERPQPVSFTRSQPCHKDDHGPVEQINAICRELRDPLPNCFLPVMKLMPSGLLASRSRGGQNELRFGAMNYESTTLRF